MIVTIVARTRMGRGACIGAIADDGRSLRLIAPDMAFNEQFNADYRVGQVWEIEADPPDSVTPPHTENVVVRRRRLVGWADDLPSLIERHMPPHEGGLDALYDGLLQHKGAGPLHVAEAGGVPPYSTTFWRPDRPLQRDTDGKRIRYRYPTADGGHTLTFVGFQEPPDVLPAGTLLRVSLAHWWRPADHPEVELRCYVQLSGWFKEGEEIERLGDSEIEPAEDNHYSPVSSLQSPHLSISQSLTLDSARATLKQVFGYDDFRPLQADIIANVLNHRDSLAIMPTGSGKSLCYQLPALLSPGLTVVVSPLISLMEDQVMQLRQLGIPAAYLNSTLPYDGYVAISHQIRAGHIKLLYSSPETLLRPETLLMLDACRVDCLTIDEAHCISEWGHDFRPEYRQLVQVRQRLGNAVCLAVTATATTRVRGDIKASLAVGDADEFISSFDRDNLFLAVEPRGDGLAQTLAFLQAHKGESGIIYCTTRAQVDELSANLAANGWNARPYHAGLDNATRRENQRRFSHDETPIIVATIAFGMGINKSNVRFVVHHDLPKDLENYYQQIGRAGRDGLPADCLLLFSRQDAVTHNFLAGQGAPSQRAATAARLQAMLAYAETDGCRRRPLLGYFGEEVAAENCGRCDNCLSGDHETVDLTVPAQKFLSCVARTDQIFGAGHIIDILRGSRSQEVTRRGHQKLSTYNIGGEFSRKEWQQLARQFVSSGLLQQDLDHGSLKLTAKGRAVLKGETYMGAPPTAERAARRAVARDYDEELFERLRVVRLDLAYDEGVPAFVIFSDASLREMAIYYPQSRESFAQMQGVGAVKLERYGETFLSVIGAYCREMEIAERVKVAPIVVARVAGRTRREEVLDLYRRGTGVAEIAEMFAIQPKTVVNHLWEAVQAGESIPAEPLLQLSKLLVEQQERTLHAFTELGTGALRPVYEALGESVSWDELHILRLYAVARQM